MDIIEAIRTRKSIRDYKPDPVPKEILEEILEVATRAPSTDNTQPWEFTVITGKVLEDIRRANVEMFNSGALSQPEVNWGWPPDSVYRQRQVELGKQLFQLIGISKQDKEKKAEWMERGFRYFDAPTAIIICVDRSLTEVGPLLDIGTVMQSICLTALHYGLGTSIEYQGIMYPEVLRKFAGIPESKRIIISIAIGYPDWELPANKVKSTREPVENITTWCGFD
jgi:nitroreductase